MAGEGDSAREGYGVTLLRRGWGGLLRLLRMGENGGGLGTRMNAMLRCYVFGGCYDVTLLRGFWGAQANPPAETRKYIFLNSPKQSGLI